MWKYLNKDCNCNTTPTNPGVVCNHDGLKANELIYRGIDVACSGVYNGMTVAEVLQQIDYYLCSLEFTQQVLDIIQDNPQEFNDFITLVNGAINCETITACGNPPSTTTTTSSSSTTSTTTSTTTLFPPECIEVEINVGTNCPGQTYALFGYTDCNGVEQEVEVGTGDLPRFCVLDIPFPAFTCGDGTIDIIGKCNPITTTTTTSMQPITTTTTTTIPLTTTTTTTSCPCVQFNVNIIQKDLDDSDDGIVYVNYINCNQELAVKTNAVAGFFSNAFCMFVADNQNPIIYTIMGGLPNVTLLSSMTKTSTCCT